MPARSSADCCGLLSCGRSSQRRRVTAYRDRQWRIVLSDAGDTKLLSTRHHGWRDISVSGRASSTEYDTTVYQYNGQNYRAAICEQTIYDDDSSNPKTTRGPC